MSDQPTTQTDVPETSDSALPVLSVVLPTYNRLDRLRQVLASMADQDLEEPFEVIVVSDGSSDGTEEYLAQGGLGLDLRWASQPNSGPAAARNRGFEMARADLIVFVDDDVVPDSGLLAAHLAAHRRHTQPVVVIGPMLTPPDHPLPPWGAWEQRMLEKQYRAMLDGVYEPTFRQFYTGNASMARDLLVEAGGFDQQYRRAEDIELAIRLSERGVMFVFAPEAKGFHYAVRSFSAWRAIAVAYGRMEIEFAQGPDRQSHRAFIAYTYRSRHPALRLLTRTAIHFPSAVEALASRSLPLIRSLDRRPTERLAQWLLSSVNAIDYWRAMADAAGGESELLAVICEN